MREFLALDYSVLAADKAGMLALYPTSGLAPVSVAETAQSGQR